MNKLPPIEKIAEAYSAIADNRIEMSENSAFVDSSDKSKRYTVTWLENLYTANDNASIWQGYAGYPMIAVLMLQSKLPLDRTIASHFKGINWKTRVTLREGTEKVPFSEKYPLYKACERGKIPNLGVFQCPHVV